MRNYLRGPMIRSLARGRERWEMLLLVATFLALMAVLSLFSSARADGPAGNGESGLLQGTVSEILVDDEGVSYRRAGSSRFEFMSIDRRRDRDESRSFVIRGKRPRLSHGPGEFEVEFDSDLDYERVNGIILWSEMRGRSGRDFVPELWSRTGYGFERGSWYYDIGILQPVVPGRWLRLGGQLYRLTMTRDFDQEIIGDKENTIAALLFKEDFREYYESEGYALLAESRLGDSHLIKASYRREELESMGVIADWSLFGRHKSFRRNDLPLPGYPLESRPVNAGVAKSMGVTYALDTRNSEENPTRGIYYRFSAERAGKGGLGGDFRYDRYAADLRHYMKLGPILYLDVRLAAGYMDADPALLGGPLYTGGSFEHRYPVHKEFYAGGISTLRGYGYKELRGDRLLLANVEYRIGGGDLQALMFADVGDAWVHAERDYDLRSNVGVGVQESGGGFRVMVAKRLDDSGGSPLWWVRLQRTF